MTAQVRCYWGSECTPDFANAAAEVTVNDNDDGLPSSPPGLRLGRLEGEPRLAVRWDEVPEATGYEVHWGEAGEPARRTAWVNARCSRRRAGATCRTAAHSTTAIGSTSS